jgi:uncharacterized protein YhbP (UPF0306 family)
LSGLLSRIHAVDAGGHRLRVSGLSKARVGRSAHGALKDGVLCSIATVARRRRAHINTAYFAFSDAWELFFLSHPGSLHCRNLAENPSIALTVFSSEQRWTDPGRGLQLFGRCRAASGRHLATAERSYGRRFPSYETWKESVADTIGREYRLYRCAVSRLKIHDEREFGDGVFVVATINRQGRTSGRRPERA